MFLFKKIPHIAVTIIVLLICVKPKAQQDLATLSSAFPNSGCMLGIENVHVLVLNTSSSDIVIPFDICYTIDGGPPVCESQPSLTASASINHTFITKADLSVNGSYEICIYTSYSGEINFSNDTLCFTVVNDTLTTPGIAFQDTLVCSGANTGSINLIGTSDNIIGWQVSTNFGVGWISPGNTTSSQSFLNTTSEKWYRVIVKNGFCPADTSTVAVVSIDPPPIGGSLSGPDTVCVPPNGGTINLAGEFGVVDLWQFSYDGGTTWGTVSNTTTSLTFTDLDSTAIFRALVSNGVCSATPSGTHTVNVKPGATGGTLSSLVSNVCIGQNSALLQLSGESGIIDHWESAPGAGGPWTNIGNGTFDTLSATNLSTSTWYQVIVQGCLNDTSTLISITVDPLSLAGVLSSDTTICEGVNSGTLALLGETGTVIDWIDSTGGVWQSSGQTGSTYSFTDLSLTTAYMVIVKNGVCPADTSNGVLVDLYPYNYGVSNDTTIIEGGVANLSAYGGVSYVWNPATSLNDSIISNPQASPIETTTYTVEITDTNTCVYYGSIEVTVEPPPIEISNLITANGDGFNDFWIIKGVEKFSEISATILNKNGVIVYLSDDYKNEWDGKNQGNYLPSGTYYYIIEHAELGLIKGHVNILTNE